MNHYSYTINPYHPCEAEGYKKKGYYQVYPSGQTAGIMHGSTRMCKTHYALFKKRYWIGVEAFYDSVMNGTISSPIIKII